MAKSPDRLAKSSKLSGRDATSNKLGRSAVTGKFVLNPVAKGESGNAAKVLRAVKAVVHETKR